MIGSGPRVPCKGSPTLQKWFPRNHTTTIRDLWSRKELHFGFTENFFCTSTTMRSRTKGFVTEAWQKHCSQASLSCEVLTIHGMNKPAHIHHSFAVPTDPVLVSYFQSRDKSHRNVPIYNKDAWNFDQGLGMHTKGKRPNFVLCLFFAIRDCHGLRVFASMFRLSRPGSR